MTTDTTLTFAWRIQYSDDDGRTWHDATGPDARGTVTQDKSIPEQRDIFQVACTQADIYASVHRSEHAGRQWQAFVDDGVGHTLGVEACRG